MELCFFFAFVIGNMLGYIFFFIGEKLSLFLFRSFYHYSADLILILAL